MFTTKALDLGVVTLVSKLNALLVTGAFIASLFFNGIDIRFFALTFILLFSSLTLNTLNIYRHGWNMGHFLIPITLILFWIWLGISIFFSQVVYLSIINFWWVGVFPLTFFVYSTTPDKVALWKLLIKLITLVVFVLCIVALYQVFVLNDQPRATFYNKNSLAALINLLIFPVLAFALLNTDRKQLIALLTILFTFIFLLALINSRGAFLGFFISLALFLGLVNFQLDKRRLLILVSLMLVAFITANFALHTSPQISGVDIIDRITTLRNIDNAGFSRFVIWKPAWDLFLQQPWTGIGLGSYFLEIPPLLHIDDYSAGFYVHNDYLQIALETGMPGFLLLSAIMLSIFFRFIKTLNVANKTDPQLVIFIALFFSLFSVAFHSIFSFNLYILPVMFVVGLFLGYFNYLADQLQSVLAIRWQPCSLLRPFVYYFSVAIVVFTLLSYFATVAIGHHYNSQARLLELDGRLRDAHLAYRLAQKFSPRVDSAYYADADLLRKSAIVLADRPDLARSLLDEAILLLDQADTLNPLRPYTPYIRGLVLEQSSANKKADIINAYQAALNRNPRFLPARIALARYLIKQDKNDAARQLLQAGLDYSYRQVTPSYLELIELNHAAAVHMGNTELAQNLSALLNKYQQIYAVMQSHGGQIKIINPY